VTSRPSPGIYDRLLDQDLKELLARYPELRPLFGKLETEEQPSRYAEFVSQVLKQALLEESDPERRRSLCNRIIDLLSEPAGTNSKSHIEHRKLIQNPEPLLLEITPPHYAGSGIPRPRTSMVESSLFTGSPREPQLVQELLEEMRSADAVDILVSFIKWSGLRLLMPGFEDLKVRRVPVRLITTSYMGASDVPAIEWLARELPDARIRISYDSQRTRLHAKAWHFRRDSGFSTAYIGSANMSHAAMTSGLEWNLKVTSQDLGHILEKFSAEFETYWHSREFLPYDSADPVPFRQAIERARKADGAGPAVFFDLQPHPFQERILEKLTLERTSRQCFKNLVIAATGTGKTVIAAFDYERFRRDNRGQARLLFIAHRQEILEQALFTFRQVLRDAGFGEMLAGSHEAVRMEHLFCSIQMMTSRQLWNQVESSFYDYIVVDEAHHGTAASYRPLFDHFKPEILLGLTATPERMDGGNVAADFHHRFAAEIRLPEALEEKLLCPFHYFGVADPVDISKDHFWRNGRYDDRALEKVYTGDDVLAKMRVDTIVRALDRYEPARETIKGIGFCVTIRHARFMADAFNRRGIVSAAYVSDVDGDRCDSLLAKLRSGQLAFLFTVDKFTEGVDVPEINMVLFLRPTQSLTVFLQQLGRGLRHAPEKECLTVLDFVGQVHRKYRMDLRLKALLPRHRYGIDQEVAQDFPHLPAGCAIQFDRISKGYVLENIRANLRNLAAQVPERLQTFTSETGQALTFGNFVQHHDYEPERLLVSDTWTGWKARAQLAPAPSDPDLAWLKRSLVRAASVSGPGEIGRLRQIIGRLASGDVSGALDLAGDQANAVYYRLWGDRAGRFAIADLSDAFHRLTQNPSILRDMEEILAWARDVSPVAGVVPDLPFPCSLELHAQFSVTDILAAFDRATLASAGQRGTGVLHFRDIKAYALLITFQKTEKEFSPTTMYADYPISRSLLHWESQSSTALDSPTGQNLVHHQTRGYTILVFARPKKKHNNRTVPFVFLGPARHVSHQKERPIQMVWELNFPMPVEMFEENRQGG